MIFFLKNKILGELAQGMVGKSLLDTWITQHSVHLHTLSVQAPVLEEMVQVRLANILSTLC